MFWNGVDVNTYKLYKTLKDTNDWGGLAELIPIIMKEYPQMVKYIINRIDSCYGEHTVYVVDTNKGIKIGYTKNTIQQRFSEKRYSNSDEFIVNKILREDKFQAKGALEFENKLKELLSEYGIKTDMVMPGKGELYDRKFVDEILNEYDSNKDKYKSIIGLKPPN
jgi:hypothetical protein